MRQMFKDGAWILAIVLTLCAISLMLSFSTNEALVGGKSNYSISHFVQKQIIFVLVGFFLMYLCYKLPLFLYQKSSFLIFVVGLICGYSTLFMGDTINGAARTISLSGISFQPIEISKICMILSLAGFIGNKSNTFNNVKNFCILIGMYVLYFIPILANSISTCFLCGMTFFLLLWIAGIKFKYRAYLCIIAICVVGLMFGFYKVAPDFSKKVKVLDRVGVFVNRISEEADNYQKVHARIAVAAGKKTIIGKLPGNSTQRFLLPRAESDYIYSIWVEETGIVGGTFVVLLYVLLFMGLTNIGLKCKQTFTSLTVAGINIIIMLQVIVHICVNLGFFINGQTLPFISSGGSSLLASFVEIGIVLCINRSIIEGNEDAKYISQSEIEEMESDGNNAREFLREDNY